jgi:hypothetical protein
LENKGEYCLRKYSMDYVCHFIAIFKKDIIAKKFPLLHCVTGGSKSLCIYWAIAFPSCRKEVIA